MAAEQMKKKVIDHLNCRVCYEVYKNPKYLPCYHSYCEGCLKKLVQFEGKSCNVTCPDCGQTSPIPTEGVQPRVQRLPNNFFINRLLNEISLKRKIEGKEKMECGLCVREDTAVAALCLNCGEFLCSYCCDDHKYRKEYQNHNVVPLDELKSKQKAPTVKAKAVFCQEHVHEKQELQFYCETCKRLTCQYCIMKNHIEHDHDMVKEMASKHRERVDKIMESVEKMQKQLSIAHEKISNTRDKIEAEVDKISKEIERCYEELFQKLKQQRDDLKKELHEGYVEKRNVVTSQLEQIECTQEKLKVIEELNSALKDASYQETLLMEKQLVDDVHRISDSYNKLDTQPVQLTTMEFVPVEEYRRSIPQFGHLFDGAYSYTSEVVDIPRWAVEGENIKFTIITRNRNNQFCHKGENTIIVHARSSRQDASDTPVDVKDNKDGSYSASFVANQVGEMKLSATLKEQQIKGSPFYIRVREKFTVINKPSRVVNKIGKNGTPWGIAFGLSGVWAVTDRSNHSVRIFDSHNKMIQTFGGSDKGKFNSPSGVAFDGNNDLYVTDSWNNRVQKFTITGRYLLQFGSHGSGDGQLNNPLGILVHNSQVYVVENGGNRISVFQLDGEFSRIIGSRCLKSPCYIASNGYQLLVADSSHHCISIFTLDGNYVSKFGTRGTGNGQLKNPIGVATLIYGFILVTDEHNRVSVFDKDGKFAHSFGSKGSSSGQFFFPRGIAISPTGNVYVCDSNNERIQIF